MQVKYGHLLNVGSDTLTTCSFCEYGVRTLLVWSLNLSFSYTYDLVGVEGSHDVLSWSVKRMLGDFFEF